MPEGLEQMPDKEFRDLIWFLLNPPQDNRPWTPALRKELLGDETAGQPKIRRQLPAHRPRIRRPLEPRLARHRPRLRGHARQNT